VRHNVSSSTAAQCNPVAVLDRFEAGDIDATRVAASGSCMKSAGWAGPVEGGIICTYR
jgi:hypothetical protein